MSPLQLREVFESIKKHKTRNFLSGFGVVWGIFILIILLGTGDGLHKGVFRLFDSFSKNSFWIVGGQTSKVDVGKVQGKGIIFNDEILNLLKLRFQNYIDDISPEIQFNNLRTVSYQRNSNNCIVKGVTYDYFKIQIEKTSVGRLFNILDEKNERKVAIIGENINNVLFEKESAIGKKIDISGNWFTVIGVLESGSFFGGQEINNIYVPYSTGKNYLNHGDNFSKIILNLKHKVNSLEFDKKVRLFLARQLVFNADDKKALFTINFNDELESFEKLFKNIKFFLWFIGVCLLLVGSVGVGNVSLVIVKERTKEIGIRKAIGAKPKSIIGLILSETILITIFSGMIGLLSGYLTIFVINIVLSRSSNENLLITELDFNLIESIIAVAILVLTGLIAGFVPAKKAVEISPIEAIRQD